MVDPFQDFLDKKNAPFVKYLRKRDVLDRVEQQLTPAIKSFVKSTFEKGQSVYPNIPELIAQELKRLPPRAIEKIIQKETIREVEKKDPKKYAEEKSVEDLKGEIKSLKEVIDRLKGMIIMRTSVPNAATAAVSSSGSNPFLIGTSWRIYDDGTNLVVQHFEGGIWVEKGSFLV